MTQENEQQQGAQQEERPQQGDLQGGQPADQQAAPQQEEPTVDMTQTAREVQEADEASEVERFGTKLIAPAKVNLFLDVGPRRADGYHEAISIMHALTLHDILYLDAKPAAEYAELHPAEDVERLGLAEGCGLVIDLNCVVGDPRQELDLDLSDDPEDNTVVRAARALARRIGREEDEVLTMRLEKHIPTKGGMGGGSSDAAAALVGCASLWGLEADDPRVEEVARTIGADVPFFLHGGCACLTGAGDVFDHALKPMGDYLVLVKPSCGVSTAEAYHAFDEAPTSIDAADRELALQTARAANVPLRNNLAPASESLLPELVEVREWLAERLPADAILLAGSGATTFARCSSFSEAGRIASDARAKGWWARTTTFGPVKAAIVPAD